MARKKKPEEHVNHERWLVSYADFITLLFAFFTSLYAISTVDAAKAGQMVFSTRAAFNLEFFPTKKPTLGREGVADLGKGVVKSMGQRGGKGNSSRQVPSRSRRIASESDAVLLALVKKFKRQIALTSSGSEVTVRRERRGIVLSVSGAALFAPGSDQLNVDFLPKLDKIIESVVSSGHPIQIEGHTDNTPVAGKWRSNWALSSARAMRVLEYVTEEFAYPNDALSMAAFAHHRPVTDERDPKSHGANRRVDIVLLTP